jgi:hypothetical protein
MNSVKLIAVFFFAGAVDEGHQLAASFFHVPARNSHRSERKARFQVPRRCSGIRNQDGTDQTTGQRGEWPGRCPFLPERFFRYNIAATLSQISPS